jgi:hypothetical protein
VPRLFIGFSSFLVPTAKGQVNVALRQPAYRSLARNLPDMPKAQEVKDAALSCLPDAAARCANLTKRADPLRASLNEGTRRPRVADRSFWLVTAGSAGASLLATAAGIHCRHRNGVEPCTAHYGAFAATEGVRFGFNAIVFPAIAYGWKSDDQSSRHSKWWVMPAAVSVFNVGYAIREFGQGCNGPRLPNCGRCQSWSIRTGWTC